VTDTCRSRLAGFHDYQPTPASFLDLFARLISSSDSFKLMRKRLE
jgi:hypothetical protein